MRVPEILGRLTSSRKTQSALQLAGHLQLVKQLHSYPTVLYQVIEDIERKSGGIKELRTIVELGRLARMIQSSLYIGSHSRRLITDTEGTQVGLIED